MIKFLSVAAPAAKKVKEIFQGLSTSFRSRWPVDKIPDYPPFDTRKRSLRTVKEEH